MAKSTTVTGINKTITHSVWLVPMDYHHLVRIEHDLISNQSIATFASYFSKDAFDKGAQYLEHTSVILPAAVSDFSDVIVAVTKNADNDLANGEAV